MVSDAELAEKVHEFLLGSDLKKTTNNIVIRKLESHFGVDLSDKKPFLRNQVDRFLQTQYNYSEEQEHDAAIDRYDDPNDDVSDSEDEYYEDDGVFSLQVQADNGSSSFKGITQKQRSHRKNKVTKRACESGKFCTLSPELQKFLGVAHMTRAEVVKQLWSYVRAKNLQDPQDGKTITCDETLRELLGVDTINILQINKALTKHIWPSEKSIRRERPRKQKREEDPYEADLNAKRPKKAYSGFLAPLPLSDTLIKFLGTGEIALTRADVIKRVWEYIKDNNLQDPFDKKTVICDEKLKELFKVNSFHGFTVSKLLTAHFVKL